MSYTVLARRYRSGTFDEVVGQEHVAQTLKKAIASDRIAHAYLFNGTRGVGKTSMARIMAKALNCRASDGPTTEPCGKCDSCLAIARGDDIDVIEIDAASNTGVDNVRDIIENAQYRPARSRFKIYIIDEVHMLSKNAFNALLKTLEEPPGHVKFILATTEPEKVLPTILSRCQRYDFRNIPTREIAAHLREISKKEKIKADEDALLLVAKAGAGSMRDALSLLDRLLSIGEKHLTVEMIEHMLGLPKSQLIFDLAQAMGEGDAKATLTRASSMVQAGLSVDGLIAALTEHLRNLLIIRTCGMESELVEVPGLSPKELTQQAEQFDPVALTQDITLLEELRRHVRQSQAGRALLDATLVRMALADQFASIGELLGRVDGNGSGGGQRPRAGAPRGAAPAGASAQKKKVADGPAVHAGAAPLDRQREVIQSSAARAAKVDPEVPAPIAAAPGNASGRADDGSSAPSAPGEPPAGETSDVAVSEEVDAGGDDDLPRPGKVWEGPKESLASLMKKHAAASAAAAPAATQASPEPSNVEGVNPSHLPDVWNALLAFVAENSQGLHGLLSHGRLVAIEGGQAVIRYGPQHDVLVRMFDRNGKKEQVRAALTKVTNQSLGVAFEIETAAPEVTPATEAPPANSPTARSSSAARAPAPPTPPPAAAPRLTPEMVQSLRENSPLVKALMDGLGAQVIKVESGT